MTQRLVSVALDDWMRFDGAMALRKVNPLRLPFPRFVRLVYAWLTEEATPESREKFDAELRRPPPGARVEDIAAMDEWDEAAAAAEFLARMGSGSR